MAPPSATATVTSTPGPAALRRTWIDSPVRDLAFYIATPLLLVPLILLRPGRPAIEELLLYVGGFGALGHHLPGMMRAYGDRALFARFRLRFILAPLLLVPVCIFFSVNDLGGVILITFFWTNWHSLMQIFGFARIYDAKAGARSRWNSRLDHALCVAWIGAPLLLSDSRLGSLLVLWYGTGGPLLSPGFIGALRTVWLVASIAVSVAWAAHAAFSWSRGRPPSLAKIALFSSSFVFWWFCMAMVDNLLVGIALFDIFHDVQYLALVWTFNKSRVAADPNVGGFSRFLFRGRTTLAGIYVGMVVAYGSLGYFSEDISQDLVRQSLLGVLAASALLHFYFDGFIWKVREQSTRKALKVDGGDKDIRLGGKAPGWSIHGAKWLLFVIPLGALYWWETHDTRSERTWREAIVESVPDSAEALTGLASVMDLREDPDRILAMHRLAIEKKPTLPVSQHNLGLALFKLGKMDEAKKHLLEAIRLLPDYALAHRHLGSLLWTTGEPKLAAQHFRSAIEHDPEDGSAYAGLALIRTRDGATREAVQLYEKALRFKPTERTALIGLAWILATHPEAPLRDGERAVEYAETLRKLTGREDPMVLDTLAAAHAEAGRFPDALATLAQAISLARARGQHQIVPALEGHRNRYQLGQPWRGDR